MSGAVTGSGGGVQSAGLYEAGAVEGAQIGKDGAAATAPAADGSGAPNATRTQRAMSLDMQGATLAGQLNAALDGSADGAVQDAIADADGSFKSASNAILGLDPSDRQAGLTALAEKEGKSVAGMAWRWLSGESDGGGDTGGVGIPVEERQAMAALHARRERFEGAVAGGKSIGAALLESLPALADHAYVPDTLNAIHGLKTMGLIDEKTADQAVFQLGKSKEAFSVIDYYLSGGGVLDDSEIGKLARGSGGAKAAVDKIADVMKNAEPAGRSGLTDIAMCSDGLQTLFAGIPKESRGAELDKLLGAVYEGSREGLAALIANEAFEETSPKNADGFPEGIPNDVFADLKAAVKAHGAEAGLREVVAKTGILSPATVERLVDTFAGLGLD